MAAAAPALLRQVQGRPRDGPTALRRNVALHADHLPEPWEPMSSWRTAQRGPRLESRTRDTGDTTLRAEAPPFAPHVGVIATNLFMTQNT